MDHPTNKAQLNFEHRNDNSQENTRTLTQTLTPEGNSLGYHEKLFLQKWPNRNRFMVLVIALLSYWFSYQLKGRARIIFRFFSFASLARSFTNLHLTQLLGWLFNPSITLKREFRVNAPIESIFMFLKSFSNYSRFMSFVDRVEVNPSGGGMTWNLQGPFKTHHAVQAHISHWIPNQAIGWMSDSISLIKYSGDIQLHEISSADTQLKVELTYAPPLGILGYALLILSGYNPKTRIDHDLNHLKYLLEEPYTKSGTLNLNENLA